MKVNWKSFKKDPNFFLKYFSRQALTAGLLLSGVLAFGLQFDFELNTEWWHFLLVPISMLLGVQLPAILHNAVHFNIRPKALNDIIGEITGFFVLFGLGPFRISHFLHHAFADTEWDTHPPEGKGFWYFLATTQLSTIAVIRRKFLQIHGNTLKNHLILVSEMGFYYVSLALRVAVIYLVLGPELFVCAYLPAYVVNVLVFAHINYATHATQEDGRTEILNLNHNVYYRFINFVGSGVYFHANHHRYPHLYNPMKGSRHAAS